MMLQPALLHDRTSGKTVENIRKLDASVEARRATTALFFPASKAPAKYGGNNILGSVLHISLRARKPLGSF
jgi:hypothetical protein